MKITHDKRVDALNIALRSGTVAKTLEVAPEIMIGVDKAGRTLNIEIIGASEKIGPKNFGEIIVGKKSLTLPAFA